MVGDLGALPQLIWMSQVPSQSASLDESKDDKPSDVAFLIEIKHVPKPDAFTNFSFLIIVLLQL